MAGSSYPFDSGPGSTISEDQWSYLMRDAVGTGVHEGITAPGRFGSELKVFSIAEPGIVHVSSGRASINGFHYQQGSAETIVVTANASATQDRIDAVVLRLDLTTNAITLEVKLGALSTTPVPPAIASSELLLATYRVRKNSSTVLGNEVTDNRTFVGRRVGVGDVGNREGDLAYSPELERWFAKTGGGTETFGYESDLSDHVAAGDPHSQYLTAAEGNATATLSAITVAPQFTSFQTGCRSINLPGGYRIINTYMYAHFNGVQTINPTTLYTINDTNLRPGGTFRFPAHQWVFANSSDDYPLMISIFSDGTVKANGELDLMGDCNIVFNGVYFKGPGI